MQAFFIEKSLVLFHQTHCQPVRIFRAVPGGVHARLRQRIGEADFPGAAEKRPVIIADIEVRLAEARCVLRVGRVVAVSDRALRSVTDPGRGQLAISERDILDSAAAAAHVPEVEIIDVAVIPTVKAVAGPDLRVLHSRNHVRQRAPDFRRGKLGVRSRSVVVVGIVNRHPIDHPRHRIRFIKPFFPERASRIECLGKGELAIILRFISQAVFRQIRNSERLLRSARIRPRVARAEIAGDVEIAFEHVFEAFCEEVLLAHFPGLVADLGVLLELLVRRLFQRLEIRLYRRIPAFERRFRSRFRNLSGLFPRRRRGGRRWLGFQLVNPGFQLVDPFFVVTTQGIKLPPQLRRRIVLRHRGRGGSNQQSAHR